MEKHYHGLTPVKLNTATDYIHTATLPELVHLDDPALDAMIDFKQIKAITVKTTAPLRHARLEMQACNVHMLLVLNNDDQVAGVITSEDILGNKPIQLSQGMSIARYDIEVRMVMQPCVDVLALSYHEVTQSEIGHIVQTMKDQRQHYALVTESLENQPPVVRGLFSLSNIGRQLHANLLEVDLMATSLIDLQRKINKC